MADLKLTPVVPGAAGPMNKPAAAKGPAGGFGQMLNKAIDSVNRSMQEADTLAAGLASGEHANIHETMIALEKAGISFRMLTKAQNKVIEAYQEVMRLQL